jgi:protein tyrosine/serine phosphatase
MRPWLDILYNFRWVVPGEAARAGQAHFGGLEGLMRRHGLKAIVNLRGENSDLSWWRYERRVCARLGAAHLDAMLDSRKLPTQAMLARLIEALEAAPRPFLLKCSGGHDRTGFAAALYLIMREGWSARAKALGEFSGQPKRNQRWLKLFVEFAREETGEGALAAWIAERYTPERLAEWLAAHGADDSYDRIFTVPTRSPFQL